MAGYTLKSLLANQANEYGITINNGISFQTFTYIFVYGLIYVFINQRVIEKSVGKLID